MIKVKYLQIEWMKEDDSMEQAKQTLVRPNLTTNEDYVKQREKSKTNFEKFVEERKAENSTKKKEK